MATTRNRQTETDRQRPIDRPTETEEIQTGRQVDKQTNPNKQKQIDKQIGIHTKRLQRPTATETRTDIMLVLASSYDNTARIARSITTTTITTLTTTNYCLLLTTDY